MFGYLIGPSAVTATILGRKGSTNEIFDTFTKFRKEFLEETGLHKDRLIVLDNGQRIGYCIILESNMRSIPPVSPELTEKVKDKLAFLGDKAVGPQWFKWCPE